MNSVRNWWSGAGSGGGGDSGTGGDSAAAPASDSDNSWLLTTLGVGGSNNAAAANNNASGSDDEAVTSEMRAGECGSLSTSQRIVGFLVCLIGGCLMLAMSCFYITKLLLGSPQKFAVSYSLANLFLLASVSFLVGPMAQLRSMWAPTRRSASLFYWLAMIATLYAVWKIHHFFVVLPLLLLQFCALAWYIATYVPYGRGALSRMFRFAFRGTLLPI